MEALRKLNTFRHLATDFLVHHHVRVKFTSGIRTRLDNHVVRQHDTSSSLTLYRCDIMPRIQARALVPHNALELVCQIILELVSFGKGSQIQTFLRIDFI